MFHYVCTECGSGSSLKGNCQNDVCVQQGTPLHECHCEDGKHDGIVQVYDKDDASISTEGSTIDLDATNE